MLRKLITDKSEIGNLKLKDVLSYDWETTSLNYLEMLPVGISFCDGNNSWYAPFKPELVEELKSIFNKDVLFIAHNQVFDLRCCYKFLNTCPQRIFCTEVAAKLIDDTKYNYDLDSLGKEYLGFGKLTTWEKVKQFGYDSQQFYDYAIQDSELAFQLWQIQKKELKEQNLEYLFFEVEMPFQFVIRDMEISGVLIDQTQREVLASEVSKRLYDIEEQMLQQFGKTHQLQKGLYDNEYVNSPINFNSNPQLIKLIESLGFEIKEKTKKEEKSVGQKTLLSLRTEHPFINNLWLYKKLQKLQSTYVVALRNTDSDGRIRASYNLVRSGRVTCAPFQQLPNYKKEENKEIGINFRKVLIPAKGYKFVCADFAGQELRVGAHVCDCKGLIKAFNENKDPHLMTANDVFELHLTEQEMTRGNDLYNATCKKYESERDKGKNGLNFPIVYGMSEYSLAKKYNVSIKTARMWIDRFFKLYPEIKISIDKTKEELYNNGYVADMMGRRRRYPDYKTANKSKKEFYERSAFNHKIQSPSAAMAKIAATKALELCDKFDARILMFLHDELVFEIKSEQCEDFVKELKPIMCGCLSLKVPIDVECKIKETF